MKRKVICLMMALAIAGTVNAGECLYNGIELPTVWPPREISPKNATSPMRVPYLEHPPRVLFIDVGRQLFVDDFLIEKTTLSRVYNVPRKYAGNPILKPETALEINPDGSAAALPKGGGIWWNPYRQFFELWYEAGWLHTICYATSTNGLDWVRPALDVVPGTNQVLPPDLRPDSWTVVPDWSTPNPLERYKLFMRSPGGDMPGLCMTSPDGIHWTNRTVTGLCGDRSSMFYNPFRQKWIFSLRAGWRARSRNYHESNAFLPGADWQWKPQDPASGVVYWLAADDRDAADPRIGAKPQLYSFDAVAYESILLGCFEIHLGPPNEVCAKARLPKITDLNFAYSRDGFHWSRPDRRAAIASERWGSGKWDTGYVQAIGNLCVIKDDTLWFYYGAFQGNTNRVGMGPNESGMYDRGAMGCATLRRDGFVGLSAATVMGEVVTRPVLFSGRYLFVNVDCPAGELRAEILDEAGRVIAPFTAAACRAVTADTTRCCVSWPGAESLDALRGKQVRFRFTVKNGTLYSFWVSRSRAGTSNGYLAGGGPGFNSLRDE